ASGANRRHSGSIVTGHLLSAGLAQIVLANGRATAPDPDRSARFCPGRNRHRADNCERIRGGGSCAGELSARSRHRRSLPNNVPPLEYRRFHLDFSLSLNNQLRELRATRAWSQNDLADKLRVSRQTVNAIETGKYDPSLPLAFKIARLFKLPIEEIFSERWSG